MNFNWIFFTLISPFLWALTNVLDSAIRRRFICDDYFLMWITTFLRLPIILLLILAYGLEFPGWLTSGGMLLAGILWAIMVIPYFKALEAEETSRVVLFLQTISIFSLILAYFFLDEVLTIHQSLAFVLIFIGGVLAAIKYTKNIWHFSKAFWLMLFASFFWAVSDVLFKFFNYNFSSFINAFILFLLGSFLTGFITLLIPNIRKNIFSFKTNNIPTRGWIMQCTSVALGITGSLTFAYALTLGKVALTSVLIQTQPLFVLLFTSILSRFFSDIDKEDLSLKALSLKIVSFFIITAGLILLYF